MCWQNVGTDKILASTKYRCQQNVGVDIIMLWTKYRHRQNYIQVQWSIFLLFWPGNVHSSWLLSDLDGVLLLRVLSPPCVVAEWLATACWPAYTVWTDFLLHCPVLVVPARHAKKSQNIGIWRPLQRPSAASGNCSNLRREEGGRGGGAALAPLSGQVKGAWTNTRSVVGKSRPSIKRPR